MNQIAYKNAFSEVLFLINQMHEENKNKISKNFLDFLKENQNNEYIPTGISLEDTNSLKRETKIILSIIYRNYFISKQEKEQKNKQDIELLNEMYSYEKIFQKTFCEEEKKNNYTKESRKTKKSEIACISNFKNIINTIIKKIKDLFM